MFTAALYQQLSVVDHLDPASTNAGTVNGAAVDMLYFNRVLYVLNIGSVGAAGTVDLKLQGSKVSGSGFADISGFAITQVTTANKIELLEINAEALAFATAGYRYVRSVLVIGANAVVVCMNTYGSVGRYKPESNFKQDAAVDQKVGR